MMKPTMRSKASPIFLRSAGALLLAIASALFLVYGTSPADLFYPHDPLFLLSLPNLCRITGGVLGIIGLVCFFSERQKLKLLLLAWAALLFFLYQIALVLIGCPGLNGYLWGFSHAFGIADKTANTLANAAFAYLLLGSCALLVGLCLEKRRTQPAGASLVEPAESLKMSCPACGVRVKFASQDLGRKIPCPQCQTVVVLRKPDEILKMSCFFCKEHIKFPAHAIGTKLKCPHCRQDITLMEAVTTRI